jgi:protein TonB
VLLGHLERHRRYPRQAERLRHQGIAHVRLTVDHTGDVSNPRIVRSSGHAALDLETLATVRRANPVPPPPTELAPFPLEVVVPVEFFIREY